MNQTYVLWLLCGLVLSLLLPSAAHAARWGGISQRCEGETTVYYSRVDAGGGSWEAACQDTAFRTPRGTSVTFLSPNHGAKNHLCSGRQCGCTGPDCGGLVSMKCVHRGADGMWGELRVNDGVCRAAGRWGAFSKESCGAGQADKYFARLDVTRGPWENACRNTPASINDNLTARYDPAAKRWVCAGTACLDEAGSREFSARCVNRQSLDKGFAGMWLEVTLENPGCPSRWGEFHKTCPELGVAQYESRLWDVPEGTSWEAACVATPADYDGNGVTVLPNPEQCVKDSLLGTGVGATGMWGRFRVKDESCVQKSFNDQQRIDHCIATLPDVQRVWTPRLAALGDQGAAGRTALSGGTVRQVAASRLDLTALIATVQKRHAGVVSRDDLAKLAAPISAVSGPLAATPVMAPGAATAGSALEQPGLIYTVGGAASGGAFFGLAAEQGVAAWFDARENLRGYTTFGFSQGAQLSVGGEGVFGIWVVNDLAALGGDSWGCSVGASTGTGVGGTLTAWFDYENNYLGATLAPGVSLGVSPVEAGLVKVHTFVY